MKSRNSKKSHFSFYTAWNLRDIGRNKLRSLMSVIWAIGVCVMIVASFAMQESFNNMGEVMYGELAQYEYEVVFNKEATKGEILDLKTKLNADAMASQSAMLSDYKSYSLSIYDASNLVFFKNTKKEFINLSSNGIYVANKVAERYGYKEGDIIAVELLNGKKRKEKLKTFFFHR